MNLLLSGFHDERQFGVIDNIQSSFESTSIHLITTRACEDSLVRNYPTLALLFWEDLFWGIQNISCLEDCLPIDSQLIEAMAPYETIVLRMMDRFSFVREYSYNQRKTMYLEYLRYWNDYVEKNEINFFISQNIPHEVYDFVLLGICEIKNIKVLMFFQSQINDLILPMRRYDESVVGLDKELLLLSSKQDDEILYPEFVKTALSDPLNRQQPFYMVTPGIIKATIVEIRRFIAVVFSSKKYYRNKWNIKYLVYKLMLVLRKVKISYDSSRLEKFYKSVCIMPNLGGAYVYLALHYQPELTTSPLAGSFVDQGLIIELLAASIPADMMLYVKEHPKQSSIGREVNFYSKYAAYRNVRFISNKCSSFDLIDGAFCVATCTGTVGWESVVRGKSILLFGDTFLSRAPGAYRIKNEQDLKLAMQLIEKDSNAVRRLKELNIFLAALSKVSIFGFCDPGYASISTTNFTVSNSNIAEYVISFIKEEIKVTL